MKLKTICRCAGALLLLTLLFATTAPRPAAGFTVHSVVLAAEAPAAATGEKAAPKDKTFFEVIKQGGFMMIPLGLTSVLMFTLVMDAAIRLRNAKLAPPVLIESLKRHFKEGDYEAAYKSCKQTPSVLGSVAASGLGLVGRGKNEAERAMEDTLAKEVSQLHTRIRYLSVIGVVSPMLGLTGTVLGMIRAFATLGQSGIGDPSALAAAIGEVLVATASGLFIAIPGFASYYYFGNRVTATAAHTEDVINSLFRGMPYPQLAGVVIGDEPIYAAAPAAHLRRTESVACPQCGHAIEYGTAACPQCQTPLSWART